MCTFKVVSNICGQNLNSLTEDLFLIVCGRRPPPAPVGITPEDMEWLIHHTEFAEAELERLYKMFKADYPRGGMFRSQFSAFFPPGLATVHFCDHVFR